MGSTVPVAKHFMNVSKFRRRPEIRTTLFLFQVRHTVASGIRQADQGNAFVRLLHLLFTTLTTATARCRLMTQRVAAAATSFQFDVARLAARRRRQGPGTTPCRRQADGHAEKNCQDVSDVPHSVILSQRDDAVNLRMAPKSSGRSLEGLGIDTETLRRPALSTFWGARIPDFRNDFRGLDTKNPLNIQGVLSWCRRVANGA